MAQEVTLGGQRLGAGEGMTQELYNYGMNSFNQGRDWRSTMAPGILYPCFKEIGTNHGTFDIDIDALVRTLPTKGPLLGSFKMQVDLFNVPFRLYQGILHNNPVELGMNMHQVYLPKLNIGTIDGAGAPRVKGSTDDDCQVSTSALIKYTGISGIGHNANYAQQQAMIYRKIQCVPELGYYDIFKNYYSNKQEEMAYVIVPGNILGNIEDIEFRYNNDQYGANDVVEATANTLPIQITTEGTTLKNTILAVEYYLYAPDDPDNTQYIQLGTLEEIREKVREYWGYVEGQEFTHEAFAVWKDEKGNINTEKNPNLIIYIADILPAYGITLLEYQNKYIKDFILKINTQDPEYTADIVLQPFKLKNIDKMRSKILANNELGDQFLISNETEDVNKWGTNSGEDGTGYPYIALVKETSDGVTWNAFEQNGLVVKTYQSDLFNNWLDNTLVEEIARRTKIDTTSGGFTPDTLILQEKIYKLLNRILVSGGTYYDWQEATYGEGVARMCEIPMYIGGMSSEIVFEEVVSNSATETQGRYQALGALGGKGTLPKQSDGRTYKKGGESIHVRMDEPGYIMGIVSITPRISVSQGNDWDRTELNTMDDLHKPELDGIGFQDLMVEQMCWWNTLISPNSSTVVRREAVGKQTAWINYQTSLDKVYGDFAKQEGYSFMVLSRQYEHDGVAGVKDLTTYIDPAKYNYAFAYQDLAAQNFWVQLGFKVTSRRKMGAQQLPNL